MIYETYLYLWVALAAFGGPGHRVEYAWIEAGLFGSQQACHSAARVLAVKPTVYRCITKNIGEQG